MAEVLLRRGFSVACMDFTGHGKSGGVFSTFGWREKDDVAELVKELRERRNINEIVLWGESQGAAAAIMYTESDSAISCMVLDSPFPRLRETFTDLMFCSVWGISLLVVPGINVLFSIIGFVALEVVRCELLRVCGYDINDVNPCESLSKYETAVPVAWIASTEDAMVRYARQRRCLHDKYKGTKAVLEFKGSHEGRRPQWVLEAAADFIGNHTSGCKSI
eukprot:GHVU01040830.1.p1 GENE.GHVU01040830.1~~GHVU01040830.1.p1  ORF type:complete len:220 (+),score=23.60 GHVU01040830.1:763-1422(+)